MKKIFYLLIVCSICVFFTGCFDKTKSNLAITELKADFLDENDSIEKIIQIDQDDFVIMVKGNKNVFDYTLYKYNIKNEKISRKLELEIFPEYIGIDEKNNYLVFLLKNSFLDENISDEIIYIDYKNMKIDKRYGDKNINTHHVVSSDGDFIAYNGRDCLYVRDINTNETTRLRWHAIDKENSLESKFWTPIKIINDNILYKDMKYESSEGVGMISIGGERKFYLDIKNFEYLGYDEETNEIYYTDTFEQKKILKIDVDTQSIKDVFEIENEAKKDVMNRYVFLSSDLEVILTFESVLDDKLIKNRLKLTNIENGEVIAVYEFEPEDIFSRSDFYFVDEKIFFHKNNKLFLWNYMK